MNSTEQVRKRILIPLTMSFVAFLVVAIASMHWFQQRNLEKDTERTLDTAKEVFKLALEKETLLLSGLTGIVKDNEQLERMWLDRDRQGLLLAAQRLFEKIKSGPRVTHFYFHDTDGVNFLRVHKPSRHSDTITRSTMRNAIETQEVSSGIELGPLGTLTLRMVTPWMIGGEIAGYIELGKEVGYITPQLKKVLDAEIVFTINKRYLDRDLWEAGMQMLGKTGDWNQFDKFVIVDSTIDAIPKKLSGYLATLGNCEDEDRLNRRILTDLGSHDYDCGFVPLYDAGNRDVGDIIILKNVSEGQAALRTIWVVMASVSGVIAAGLIVIFSHFLKGIENKLLAARDELTEKIAEQEKTAISLLKNEQRLKKEAAQRLIAESEFEKQVHELENIRAASLNMMEDAEHARSETEQANRQLRGAVEQANLMAREAVDANRAKSEFLANMSHEIRTPMNSIVGFGDILAVEELSGEQKQYVRNIQVSSQNLLHLLNDILDFSKIEAGKLDTEMIKCDMVPLLENIDSQMRPSAKNKNLDFRVLQCGQLPSQLRTDPSRLCQCLINLVGNAIKFTENGHVYINVSMEKADDGAFIRFDVEDTGIGISKDKLETIFESFTQADGSTTREYGGTGLGLTITQQLSQLLGGDLTVKSQAGKGSVFSLTIPAGVDVNSVPPMDKYEHINGDLEPKEDNAQLPMSGKVLVAEDNRANQMLVKLMLEKMGFEVTIANDGRQAFEIVSRQPHDLILMDIQMPRMNGYEATEAIRRKGIRTPIIALTANAMKGDDKKCFDAGCDAYVSKPVNRTKLYELMKKYIMDRMDSAAEKIDSVQDQVDGLNKLCDETLSGAEPNGSDSAADVESSTTRPN